MQNRHSFAAVPQGRARTIGVIGTLIVLVSVSTALFLLKDRYRDYEIKRLIHEALAHRRYGEGRLFDSPYSLPSQRDFPDKSLGQAQLLLLGLPDSDTRRRLQGSLYLATGDWKQSVESLAKLGPSISKDAAVINDLGVAYLGLGQTQAVYLFKAMDQFEQAARLAPEAPEPLFNLVVLYRMLRLSQLAEETLQKYLRLDAGSPWKTELAEALPPDESLIHEQLTKAAEANNLAELKSICENYPELCRRIAMQYATHDVNESAKLVRFIGEDIRSRFGDETITAMLEPLFGTERQQIVQIRQFVEQGAQLYLQSKSKASLEAYTKADDLVKQSHSVIDPYWIDINRADTQIRAGQIDLARSGLDRIIEASRRHQWKWLLAKALTIYGSAIGFAPSHAEMMEHLQEAETVYTDIGSIGDTVRPLYYLAALRHAAGDREGSLNVATQCLRLTAPSDAIRLASLYWLIGDVLYKQGLSERAVHFESESVEQCKRTRNPVLLSAATSALALLYEGMSQPLLAERYLKDTGDALEKIQPGFERIRAEINANLLKGRILLNRNRYTEAEQPLTRNLSLYAELPLPPSYLQAQSRMLLGKVYAGTGRIDEARRTFKQSIDVVENDDNYLQNEKLRLTFDDERRELYDSAIVFEYDHGSPDAAWSYLQKYRAKMFLEFLAQFNPDVKRIQSDALERSFVQNRIPSDMQVIEYVLLKDRLLIWVTSKDLFTSRSVPITQAVLNSKIQEVLAKLRNSNNADAVSVSRELYKILIEPVADLLAPERALAIIPDGSLHGLPFATIRYPDKPDYLIEHYPLIVSPSLTHLLATNGAQPERNAIVSFAGQNDGISEIRELSSLKKMYQQVTAVVGNEVSKKRFLETMDTAPIFHYAGHSAYDAADPLRSSILLDGNRYGPNSVTAVDISQRRMRPNAVVVLSSCDSSVGNSKDGIGMRGLTSAFLIGGAGSVVGSLWPVEESSTTELMIRFHEAFTKQHLPVAQALRQAQLSFIKAFPQRAHPYYWSGFVVTGNFSALR